MEYAEASKKAKKTLKGHKGRLRIAFYYVCECGWTGAQALGKGARSAAAYDFQTHKLRCVEATA
jgi:hypothetical protein